MTKKMIGKCVYLCGAFREFTEFNKSSKNYKGGFLRTVTADTRDNTNYGKEVGKDCFRHDLSIKPWRCPKIASRKEIRIWPDKVNGDFPKDDFGGLKWAYLVTCRGRIEFYGKNTI